MFKVLFLSASSTLYLYYVVAAWPIGRSRLLLALPVLAAYLAAPRILCDYATSVSAAGALGFVVAWLGCFKVLGLCMGRGPLSTKLSFPQFALLLLLPLKPAGHVGSTLAVTAAPSARLQSLLVKAVVLSTLTFLFTTYQLPSSVKTACYATYVWLLTDVMLEGPSLFAKHCLGLEMAPGFDTPPLATSVSNFWGRRYNLVVSQALKNVVYEPILEGQLVAPPSPPGAPDQPTRKPHASHLRQAVAVLAVFIVSGLMHELVLWYMCGVWPIRQFVFFGLQGPLVLLERVVSRRFAHHGFQNKHSPLYGLVYRAITLGLLLVMADCLFFPVFMEHGLDQKGMREIRGWLANGVALITMLRG